MDKSDKRKALFVLVTIVALAIVPLAACTSPTSQPQAAPTSPAASPSVETPQVVVVQRVSLEESKAAFDSNAAMFLDVRRTETYATSHIPGAQSIPLAEVEARIAVLDPNQWIITYCT